MASSIEIANNYFNEAEKCLSTKEVEHALDDLHLASAIFLEEKDNFMYIKSLAYMAIAYSMLGQISPMIQTITSGLTYCTTNQIKGSKHMFYNTICDRYMTLNKFDSASDYGLMGLQEIEENPDSPLVDERHHLLTCMNLSSCYVQLLKLKESEKYLNKAREISEANNLHYHDFSMDVLELMIHAFGGDRDFVEAHKENFQNHVKNIGLSMADYLQDVQNIVNVYCRLRMYDDAIAIVGNIQYVARSDNDPKLIRDVSKMYMDIYSQNGDTEAYHLACVAYAENDMSVHKINTEKELMDLDTTIALSIAESTFDLI